MSLYKHGTPQLLTPALKRDLSPSNWCGTKHYAPYLNVLGMKPVQNILNQTVGVITGT